MEEYYYLVTDRALRDDEALKIADVPGEKDFNEFAFTHCDCVYCTIEEDIDREYFRLTCPSNAFQEIVNCINALNRKEEVVC